MSVSLRLWLIRCKSLCVCASVFMNFPMAASFSGAFLLFYFFFCHSLIFATLFLRVCVRAILGFVTFLRVLNVNC